MKVKVFVIGILIFIVGIALQFMKVIAGFPEWLSYAGVPLSILGVYVTVFCGIDWNKPSPRSPLPKIEKDVIVEYFTSRLSDSTVRLFLSEDRMARIRICSQNEVVFIASEQLILFGEDELKYANGYGWWAPVNLGSKSIYDSVETAIKENAPVIAGMNEVLLPLPEKPKYKIKFIRPKKFVACLKKALVRVDGEYYVIKSGQTVEVEANVGMHIMEIDGTPVVLENLDTDCCFTVKANFRFTGSYFTLEEVGK